MLCLLNGWAPSRKMARQKLIFDIKPVISNLPKLCSFSHDYLDTLNCKTPDQPVVLVPDGVLMFDEDWMACWG